MTLRRTPEQEKLEEIFRPYMDGCHLRDDAPPEAVEAHDKYFEIYEKTRQEEIASWFE